MKTVATVPGAFYLVCCAALVAALTLTMFIQLRGRDGALGGQEDADGTAEEEEFSGPAGMH